METGRLLTVLVLSRGLVGCTPWARMQLLSYFLPFALPKPQCGAFCYLVLVDSHGETEESVHVIKTRGKSEFPNAPEPRAGGVVDAATGWPRCRGVVARAFTVTVGLEMPDSQRLEHLLAHCRTGHPTLAGRSTAVTPAASVLQLE